MTCNSFHCVKKIFSLIQLLSQKPDVYIQVTSPKGTVKGLFLEFEMEDSKNHHKIAVFRCRLTGMLFLRDGQSAIRLMENKELALEKVNAICQQVAEQSKQIKWTIKVDWQKSDDEIEKWQHEFPLGSTTFQVDIANAKLEIWDKSVLWTQTVYKGGFSSQKPLQLTSSQELSC